jgi:hypothetical protein
MGGGVVGDCGEICVVLGELGEPEFDKGTESKSAPLTEMGLEANDMITIAVQAADLLFGTSAQQ